MGYFSALRISYSRAQCRSDISIRVDWRVMLYTFALSVGTGLLFGLVPAMDRLAAHF